MAGCIATAIVIDGADAMRFDSLLEGEASSSSVLEDAASIIHENLTLIRRVHGGVPGLLPLSIDVAAPWMVLERYEMEANIFRDPVGDRPTELSPTELIQRETRIIEDGRLRLFLLHENASLILQVGSAMTNAAPGRSLVEGVVTDPIIRGDRSYAINRELRTEGEYSLWRLEGNYLRLRLGPAEGTSSGPFKFYWSNAVAQVEFTNGTTVLDSHSSDASIVGNGLSQKRTVVWYEAWAYSGDLTFSTTATNTNEVSWAHSQKSEFLGTTALAVDRSGLILHNQPQLILEPGSSYWMKGLFNVLLASKQPIEGTPGSGSNTYSITVSGSMEQYSVGGLAARRPIHSGILVGGSLLLAFGLAHFLKDFLAIVGGRFALPFYTKLKKEELLNVETRETIFRAIQQAPGIHFLALHRFFKSPDGSPRIAFGALAYHLSQMERFELILSKREGRYRRYFEVGPQIGGDAARIALLQTNPVPIVARAILRNPGITQARLFQTVAPELGATRQAVAYHVRRLVARELVVREARGKFCHYRATERLVRLANYIEAVPQPVPSAA